MKKAIIIMLCAAFIWAILSEPLLAFDKKSLKGQEFYTRTNLKVKGGIVFFHNMSKLGKGIPYGTKVVIIGAGGRKIRFKILETGKKYVVTDEPQVYSKYFVKDLQDIGISNISQEVKSSIENMEITDGMTKDEVLVSKGCPAYLAYGEKTWGHSIGELMESDIWFYNADTRRREMVVQFKDGRVFQIQGKR